MPVDHLWAEMDALTNQVLAAFADGHSHSISDVPVDQPYDAVRVALEHLVHAGRLTTRWGSVHTTYQITEEGKRHLANTMKVA